MKKESGVFKVPCKVNGLDLEFIFDTGASNVTISLTEALFMLKNNYLDEKDIYGTSYAQLANGSITENTSILIKSIEISGLKLQNVKASIVHNLDAPLLLGQSALEKLGSITIDYQKNILIIGNYIDSKTIKSNENTLNQSNENIKISSPDTSLSYALGIVIGQDLTASLGLTKNDLNVQELSENLVAVIKGDKKDADVKEASIIVNTEAPKLVEAKKNNTAKTIHPKLSVALGTHFGSIVKKQGIAASEINASSIANALNAILNNSPADIDANTANAIINREFQKKQEIVAQQNLEAGKKFLEENLKKNPNLKTTASGLQYEILKQGDGPKPLATDKVLTHYHGTRIDGSVFDSSVERGEQIEFGLNQVIRGWTEILQLMPKGSKWRVFIPSDLSYVKQGSPGGIAPNSTLVFEIELFKIN